MQFSIPRMRRPPGHRVYHVGLREHLPGLKFPVGRLEKNG